MHNFIAMCCSSFVGTIIANFSWFGFIKKDYTKALRVTGYQFVAVITIVVCEYLRT